jgi:hypothetical protein
VDARDKRGHDGVLLLGCHAIKRARDMFLITRVWRGKTLFVE